MKLRLRAPSPAVVISLIALFVALGGTAYASGLISGRQIADHSIPAKKLTAAAINALGARSFHKPAFAPDAAVHRLTTTHGIEVSYKCDRKKIHFFLNPHAGGEAMFVSGDYAQDGVVKSLNRFDIADFSGETVNVDVIAWARHSDGKVSRIDLGGVNREGEDLCDVWGLITAGA